jgi:hypothetical protein
VGPRAVLDAVMERNSQSLPGLEHPINQPVAQRYTEKLRFARRGHYCGSRNSSLVRRWVTDWMIGVRVSAGARDFSLHHRVQTASGAHPASYPMDTRGSLTLLVKRLGREADQLVQRSRMRGARLPLLQCAFMARCLAKAWDIIAVQ